MRTCPACHRPVPDDAAKCPHPSCGYYFEVAPTRGKRPPPPPTRVQLAGNDAPPATPRSLGPPPTVGARIAARQTLAWLFAIFAAAGLVAAALLAYLPWSPEKKASPIVVAGKLTTWPTAATTPSPQQPNHAPPSKSHDTQTTAADDPWGIVVDQPKSKMNERPTDLLADAPATPAPAALPQPSKLALVADTPQGLYGGRTQPKTAEWLAERGGTIESQKAVEDGLNWLARHQGQDGHWGADCLGAAPNSRCDPKTPCQGAGADYEIAQTGMALLAFQAAGHYYFNGQKYSAQVAKGLDYFVEEQAPDGSIVGSKNPTAAQIKAGASFERYFMYEHAMGTFALCEACAVAVAEGKTPNPRYQNAAERAVAFIEQTQHHDGGWRYTTNASDQSDCSVSGWVMLALKTAREANLSVSPQTVSRMMSFFAAHFQYDRTHYIVESGQGGFVEFSPFSTDAMTGVGMMAVEFFEHKLDSPVVQGGAAYLIDRIDANDGLFPSGGYYLWYNCTMAMFQAGGEPWKRWNSAIRDPLIALQVQGKGCERGSWPPNDPWGVLGGRIYSTALAVLTLEVYYRFQRIAGQGENEQFFGK